MENINNIYNIKDDPHDENFERIRVEQKGGFVDILFFLLTPFIAIVGAIFNFFINFGRMLFSENLIPIYKENGSIRFGSPEGEGVFWKYLWWCIKTSFYLVIFALGGIGFSLVGIVMIYKKLFSRFSVATNDDDDVHDVEKQRISDDEAEQRLEEELPDE